LPRRLFVTPPKRLVTLSLLIGTVILSPAVVTYYYFFRLMRGDFPSDADAIAIPIVSDFFLIYIPSLILLVGGVRRYTGGVSLFNWPRHPASEPAPDSKVWSTMGFIPPFLSDIAMILDAASTGLPAIAFYFVLHLLCVVVLRATSVNYSTPARALEARVITTHA